MHNPHNGQASTGDPVRARMATDVDAPDKVAWGLTFRQLAILAIAAVIFYGIYRALHTVVPMPALVIAAVVFGGLAFGLAVGQRDGLPLDLWFLAAIRHRHAPKALAAGGEGGSDAGDTSGPAQMHSLPEWAPAPAPGAPAVRPAPLGLPVGVIDDGGQLHAGGSSAALVAATTVNLALRTPEEQHALVDGFGRWLNSLTTPTQIVVSAQPAGLAARIEALRRRAGRLPHPALARAATGHAEFLAGLASQRDPLRRQILVVSRTATGETGGHAARRRADDTARALASLGVTAQALGPGAVTAALAAAFDPYRPPHPGTRATATTPVTAARPRPPASHTS